MKAPILSAGTSESTRSSMSPALFDARAVPISTRGALDGNGIATPRPWSHIRITALEVT